MQATTRTKKQRTLAYNALTGTLHLTDERGREVGYYVDRLDHDFGDGALAVRLTKIVPPAAADDDAAAYAVLVGPDYDACDCRGHSRYGYCKHTAAVRCLRQRGSL